VGYCIPQCNAFNLTFYFQCICQHLFLFGSNLIRLQRLKTTIDPWISVICYYWIRMFANHLIGIAHTNTNKKSIPFRTLIIYYFINKYIYILHKYYYIIIILLILYNVLHIYVIIYYIIIYYYYMMNIIIIILLLGLSINSNI